MRAQFSDKFADDLMKNDRGFVDVPVGDYKESHLFKYPHLILLEAPKIKYQQKEGMNLCVPNALASVLHVLGFTREAEIIHKYGMTEMLHSPLMNALDMTF